MIIGQDEPRLRDIDQPDGWAPGQTPTGSPAPYPPTCGACAGGRPPATADVIDTLAAFALAGSGLLTAIVLLAAGLS